MKIVYVHADREEELNTAIWRCEYPAHALREAGHEAEVMHWRYLDVDKVLKDKPDVVVFQRYCWNEAINQIKAFKKAGVVTVYDYDDDYHEINETNTGYKFWKLGKGNIDGREIDLVPPPPLNWHEWIKDQVDIVTTPSVHLVQKYGGRLLENMPSIRYWKKVIFF